MNSRKIYVIEFNLFKKNQTKNKEDFCSLEKKNNKPVEEGKNSLIDCWKIINRTSNAGRPNIFVWIMPDKVTIMAKIETVYLAYESIIKEILKSLDILLWIFSL